MIKTKCYNRSLSVAAAMIVFLLAAAISSAEEAVKPKFPTDFTAMVDLLTGPDTKTITSDGPCGTKITCTLMPKGEVVAVAWIIENPGKHPLDINKTDIKLSDQVKTIEMYTPDQAASILFGRQLRSDKGDPFVDEIVPEEYEVPDIQPNQSNTDKLFASSFSFGKTDSPVITGLVYYPRLGRDQKFSSEVVIDADQTVFDFK